MDETIIRALLSLHGRVPFIDGSISFAASVLPYIIVAGCVVFFWVRYKEQSVFERNKARVRYALVSGLAVLVAWGLAVPLIRIAYPVERPFVTLHVAPLVSQAASKPAFPSGHAAFLFALAMSVWYENRRAGIYMLICAGVNAVARVYALVHWPSDVIVGAVLGCAAAWLVRKYTKKV